MDRLENDNKAQRIFIVGNKSGERWEEFAGRFRQLEAAGGVVRDKKNNVLMIYRFEKWDLPKGKKEEGESISETALREVSEECGIGRCEIKAELPPTFHTYKKLNTAYLKKTYWFEMFYSGSDHIRPQIEEGITDIKWMTKDEARKALSNSYASIKSLLTDYLA